MLPVWLSIKLWLQDVYYLTESCLCQGFVFLSSLSPACLLSLLMIRSRLRLKMMPRFTKMTRCSKILLCCLSPPSQPLPLPTGCHLIFPCSWALDVPAKGGSWAPREASWHPSQCLCHPPCSALAPACAPAAADHRSGAPGGRLNPLLLMLGMQEVEPQLAFLMQGGFAAGESTTIIFGLVNQTHYI